MGKPKRSQKITGSIVRLAITSVMAGLIFSATAAENSAESTSTPEPEPTPVPRPDDLNLKKLSTADEILARDWLKLTLLKANDLPGLKQPPEFADAALRKRINDSFGLPAIMTMKDPARNPPQWWTPEAKGLAALHLGPTRHFDRPELKIEAPMLRLREIAFLKGESEFVRTMNEVVRLWTLGRLDQAAKLRAQLQSEKKKLPRGNLERTAVAIINGFFDLQLALEAENPVDFYGPSLASLWDALGQTDPQTYAPEGKLNAVDEQLFTAALAEPALFSASGIYPPRLKPPKLKSMPVELDVFVRTLALPTIFNIASLAVHRKNWTRVYDATQKFEDVYKRLDKSLTNRDDKVLSFTTPPGVAASHPMLMRPQTAHQLQIILRMLRVRAQFVAQDPLLALRETAKVILDSRDPAFKTLGYTMAGDIYDDLGYPNYARRFYAFAEVFADINWYQQNPYFVLRGAENAFWSGDYSLARAGFEKFLLSAGDKQFGPWARLRLAEITHLQSGSDSALPAYEKLNQSQPAHPAGLIARRRIFCLTSNAMGARNRHQEYMSLKGLFDKFELAEVEQVRACQLGGLIDDASKISANTMKSLPDEARLQLELIDEFKEKFPLSSYLKFFETRRTALQAAMGPYLLAFKQCGPALQFYRENEKKIATLKAQSGQFLSTLKWTAEEQERLVRCAALFSSSETLAKLPVREPDAAQPAKKGKKGSKARAASKAGESPDQRLVRLTLAMTMKPSDQSAVDLMSELRRRGRRSFIDDIKNLESVQSQSIDDPEFWARLATLRVMQWDLEQPAANKPKLNKLMRSEVLRQPEQSLAAREFCERFLLESSSLNGREWDSFVLAVPTTRWLELSGVSSNPPADAKPKAAEKSCPQLVAADALQAAQSKPSLARDRHLLWPWLQARGAQKEQEAWLALGQRWSAQGSVSKQELENLFKTLLKEADNPAVKQAARAWLETQKPSGLW